MKIYVKKIMAIVITIILIIIILKQLTDLVERKSSNYSYSSFFEESKDYDVLFLGSSHVINAVFPMELWNNYGITSYNLGGHGNAIATSYWVLKNALNYSTPKLVVIDCLFLESPYKTSTEYNYVHQSFDVFPLTPTKVMSVLDLLNDPEMDKWEQEHPEDVRDKRTPIGLLWDFSVYHSRWNELVEDDFIPKKSFEKGAYTRTQIALPLEVSKISDNDMLEEDTISAKYLYKIIEECQSSGIDVLLTYLPFPANEMQQKSANRMEKIAQDCGIHSINFLKMDNLINYDIDLSDPNSHLNASGAQKVTNFLGNYLRENYNISDHRNDDEYSRWNDDYLNYIAFKSDSLKAQTSLDVYLMLLADNNYSVDIDIFDKSIYDSNYICELLENLGCDVSMRPTHLEVRGGSGAPSKAKAQTYAVRYRSTGELSGEIIQPDVWITVKDNNTDNIIDEAVFQVQTNDKISDETVITTHAYH